MTSRQAMLCAALTFFGWVLVDMVMKMGGQQNVPPFFITGIFGLTSLIGLMLPSLHQRKFSSLRPRRWAGPALIGLCSLVINYLNVISLKHLPFTIFYLTVFSSPFVTAIAVSLLKHEKMTATKILCLIAGFAGVAITVGMSDIGGGEWIGFLTASLSVCAFVAYSILINRISQKENATSIQFTASLVLTVASIFGVWGEALPDAHILIFLALAGFGNLLANIFYNKALQYTRTTNVAQMHYTQIVWGALVGYFMWGEVPTPALLLGSVVIVISGLVVAQQAHREEVTAPVT